MKMKRDKRFLVFLEEDCPACGGQGVYQHPDWRRFFDELGWNAPLRAAVEWFRENGYPDVRDEEDLPAEELVCGDCGGSGVLRQRVPLEDALRELGFLVGKAGGR